MDGNLFAALARVERLPALEETDLAALPLPRLRRQLLWFDEQREVFADLELFLRDGSIPVLEGFEAVTSCWGRRSLSDPAMGPNRLLLLRTAPATRSSLWNLRLPSCAV